VAGARVVVGKRDGHEREDERGERQRQAPRQLGTRLGRIFGQKGGSRHHVDVGDRLDQLWRRADAYRVALELADLEVAATGLAQVAVAVFEHQFALALFIGAHETALGEDRRQAVFLDRTHEQVARGARGRVEAFDEIDAPPALRLLEYARRDRADFLALLERLRVFAAARLRPRADHGGAQRDQQGEGQGETQHRADPGGQRLAGGEPDRHLVVTPGAAEHDQHADEHGQDQHDGKEAERPEADQRGDCLVGDASLRGAAEHIDGLGGQEDQEQHEKDPDAGRRQLAREAFSEKHVLKRLFLTICQKRMDNGKYTR